MAYLLSPDSIIFCSGCERHEYCCLEVRFYGYLQKDAVAKAEGDVVQLGWCDIQFGSHVISQAKEEETHNYNHAALPLE